MANECTLWVNGMIYGGWTAIRINRGIEQLAGSFTLSVTEKWPGQAESRPIKKGDSAVVKIDGEAVCSGYINRTRIGFDSGRQANSTRCILASRVAAAGGALPSGGHPCPGLTHRPHGPANRSMRSTSRVWGLTLPVMQAQPWPQPALL